MAVASGRFWPSPRSRLSVRETRTKTCWTKLGPSVSRLQKPESCLSQVVREGSTRPAKQGALQAGGRVVCVLSDSLERRALQRDNRSFLKDGQLLLLSPYDPLAGFNVGHAMQRNKLIYALSDAALVMNSEYNRGGTWTGAVEQLEKLDLVPVYVPANASGPGTALHELRVRGALPWPDPDTPQALVDLITSETRASSPESRAEQLRLTGIAEDKPDYRER